MATEEAMLPPKLNSLGTIRFGGAAVALAASACFETVRTSMSGVSEVAFNFENRMFSRNLWNRLYVN